MRMPTYRHLSKDEDLVLNAPLASSLLVASPPGSHMAEFAFYRAASAVEIGSPGELIVPDTMSKALFAVAAREAGVRISTWSEWFNRFWYSSFDGTPPLENGGTIDWTAVLSRVNAAGCRRRSTPAVVMNGQRLPMEAYLVIGLVHEAVSVFAHEQQRITDSESTLGEIETYLGLDEAMSIGAVCAEPVERVARWFAGRTRLQIPETALRSGDPVGSRLYETVVDLADRLSRRSRMNPSTSVAVFLPSVDEQLRLYRALERLAFTPQMLIPDFADGAFEDIDVGDGGLFILPYQAATTGLMFDHVAVAGLDDGADWWTVDPRGTDMLMYQLCASARDSLELSATGGWPSSVLDHLPLDMLDDGR